MLDYLYDAAYIEYVEGNLLDYLRHIEYGEGNVRLPMYMMLLT